MRLRVSYLDCHERREAGVVLLPSDTHRKPYYVHYSWFTSIYDLPRIMLGFGSIGVPFSFR
jgi:hypothetical protein